MKYDTDGPAILKRISLDISSQEKIGIVGRTGTFHNSDISWQVLAKAQ